MPLQEFWNEDPDLLWSYRTFYMNKQKSEAEMVNYQAWLQGIYNAQAVASVFSKNVKYYNKPIDLYEKTKKDKQLELASKIKDRAMKCKAELAKRSEKKG